LIREQKWWRGYLMNHPAAATLALQIVILPAPLRTAAQLLVILTYDLPSHDQRAGAPDAYLSAVETDSHGHFKLLELAA
jgi:hypothetical protein